MDWALFVAVLSLLFTGWVSFITIRYTKKSLNYTKKNTQIAIESLDEAKKSIDTSIELYEKQKNDYEEREKKEKDKLIELNNERVNSIRVIASLEAFNCIKQMNFFFNLYYKIEKAKEIKLVISPNKHWKQIYLFKEGVGFDAISIPEMSSNFDQLFLLEATLASTTFITILGNLNGAIRALNTNIDHIIMNAKEKKLPPIIEMIDCMVNGNINSGVDLIKNITPAIRELEQEMRVINGFNNEIKKFEDNVGRRPYKHLGLL
ncbi:hypothetical protein [Proteus terrae]|uniref:hypothetical protein n=1 Tax=Proteus terrae TaxID=1574161 RepID=UPI00301BE8F9